MATRYPCAGTTKKGKPCSRTVDVEGAVCGLHKRRLQKQQLEPVVLGELIPLNIPNHVAAEDYEYNPRELAAWLRSVRLGNETVTVHKAKGGSGELEAVEVSPDFTTRMQAAALEMRLGPQVQTTKDLTDEEIEADIMEALGMDSA